MGRLLLQLVRHVAAIHCEYSSGDEACTVGGQPEHHLCDILRFAKLAKRNSDQELGTAPRDRFRGHVRIDPSWADAVDADLRSVLNRRGLGQADDSVLARGVPRGRRKPVNPAREAVFTIDPEPCWTMCSSSAFMHSQVPFRFT